MYSEQVYTAHTHEQTHTNTNEPARTRAQTGMDAHGHAHIMHILCVPVYTGLMVPSLEYTMTE